MSGESDTLLFMRSSKRLQRPIKSEAVVLGKDEMLMFLQMDEQGHKGSARHSDADHLLQC